MRVSGLLFWVQDNRASEKFYKKLGFEVTRSDDNHSVVKLGIFELKPPATEPRDWEWGNREFIIKDPDGYKLCFSQKSKA
jgi:catechol 2,3-dioxygenase-like lactoylglutathione lyase family enzyme